MNEDAKHSAFMSALTTEHSVLQTASSSTVSETAARSSLYVFSLSSTLVALGFTSQSPDMFMPFVATVLPALFLMGVFTVIRLVDITVENFQHRAGIARILAYYRTLTPDDATFFAASTGRWPEDRKPPSQGLGPIIAGLGTTAFMVAFVNNTVAGVVVALGVRALLGGDRLGVALACGGVAALMLMYVFAGYQRWRFANVDLHMDTPVKIFK
jgi:hypothetical protein